jgi:hypothetical protein
VIQGLGIRKDEANWMLASYSCQHPVDQQAQTEEDSFGQLVQKKGKSLWIKISSQNPAHNSRWSSKEENMNYQREEDTSDEHACLCSHPLWWP